MPQKLTFKINFSSLFLLKKSESGFKIKYPYVPVQFSTGGRLLL